MAGVIRTLLNPPAGYVLPKPAPKAPAPVAPAATQYPSSLNLPRDFLADLHAYPGYAEGEAALQNTLNQAKTGAASSAKNALIRYGYSGGDLGDPDLTPADYAAAAGNTTGIFQQLLQAYHNNLTGGRNNLESRGILNSGAKNAVEGRIGTDYTNQYAGNLQNLRDLVSSAIASVPAAQSAYGIGHSDLVSRIADLAKNDPTLTSTTAHLVDGSQAQYGQAIYAGPDGSLYTANGQPYTPTTFTPPQPVAPAPQPVTNYPTALYPESNATGYQGYGKGPQL